MSTTNRQVSLLAAMDLNSAIGRENQIPWHLPEDLRLFKRNTYGKTVVMGRRTAESIGRALPGRRNIVLTRQPNAPFPEQETAHSFSEVLLRTKTEEELCVIGGQRVYEDTLQYATKLYLTLVLTRVINADTFFPYFDMQRFKITETRVYDEVDLGDGQIAPPFLYLELELRNVDG